MQHLTSKEELTKASRIARLATLRDIFLSGFEAGLNVSRESALRIETIEFLHMQKLAVSYTEERGEAEVAADLSVTVFESGRKRKSRPRGFVRVSGKFVLIYSVKRPPNVSEAEFGDALRAFAEINGVYNAWPYFRELVQASAARMGIPPITLPLLRIQEQSESEVPEKTKPARLVDGSAAESKR